MTTQDVYKIPAERLSVLEKGVEKLNRRAKKLGFEPVVLVASEPLAEQRKKTVVVRYTTRIEVEGHSYYSPTDIKLLVIMTDEKNSKLKTFTTSSELFKLDNEDQLKQGEWYLYGTVKRHEQDKRDNAPVTVLTRVVLRRDPAPAKKPSKPRKVCPSKGKPMYNYPTMEDGRVTEGTKPRVMAFGWKCPKGVAFDWNASGQGMELEAIFLREYAIRRGLAQTWSTREVAPGHVTGTSVWRKGVFCPEASAASERKVS